MAGTRMGAFSLEKMIKLFKAQGLRSLLENTTGTPPGTGGAGVQGYLQDLFGPSVTYKNQP